MTAPWELAKTKACQPQLQAVIYNLLEGLRIISGLIYPIMPETAATMQKHLGCDPTRPFYKIESIKTWKGLAPGTRLPKSTTLFPRIDLSKGQNMAQPGSPSKGAPSDLKPEITIDEFARLDLRVAKVIHAEAIPRAKKLLKLEIDLGERELRTLVAGIAESYAPGDLIGRQIVVVANLKPAKLMGVLSRGMLLAASTETASVALTLDKEVAPGVRIK